MLKKEAKIALKQTVYCTACEESYDNQLNRMLCCYVCKTTIHQFCQSEPHQMARLDLNNWWCQSCLALHANAEQPECSLCPNQGMTLKRFRVFSFRRVLNLWAHVGCINNSKLKQLKGSSFQSNSYEYDTRTEACSLCVHLKGPVVSCSKYECQNAFHYSCARNHGLVLRSRPMQYLRSKLLFGNDKRAISGLFCLQHIMDYWDENEDSMKLKEKSIFKEIISEILQRRAAYFQHRENQWIEK